MRLTVTCPECQSEYQVDSSLRGKRMRCPNPICRAAFEVKGPTLPHSPAVPVKPERTPTPDPRPSATPIQPDHSTPTVRSPQPTPSTPKAPERSTPSWSTPPPIRATTSTAVPRPSPAPIDEDFPDDTTADATPRLPATPGSPSVPKSPADSSSPNVRDESPSARRRLRVRVLLVSAGLLIVVLGTLSAVIVRQYGERQRRERAEAIELADAVYRQGDYAHAARLYQRLQNEAVDGRDRFRFRATLSELRAEADAARDESLLAEVREHLFEFLDAHEASSDFRDHAGDVFDTARQVVKRSTDQLADAPTSAGVDATERIWTRVRPLAPKSVAAEDETYRDSFARLRKSIADRQRRDRVLADLTDWRNRPTAKRVGDARQRVADAGLGTDSDVSAALAALRRSLREAIAFDAPDPAPKPRELDYFPLIPFATVGTGPPARGETPVVALSPAGVLYALESRKGELLWARRLGVDSRFAPVRISAADGSPRWLVVSNQERRLTLLDPAGKSAWDAGLSADVVAPPAVFGHRVVVPLADHRLDVFDSATGRRELGVVLDQPAANAGTLIPETSRLAVPGRADALYLLDLERRQVADIVETDHPAGSILAPPIVVPDEAGRAGIVLVESRPGGKTRLRTIPYSPKSPAPRKERDVVVDGTLSDPPAVDLESILAPAEEGTLHRIGLRLRGNPRDPLLFPLTPATINLDAPPEGTPMRARVVHRDADNIWVVSAGRLQRLLKSFTPTEGPVVRSRWPRGLFVGEPLDVAQVHTDDRGTILFLPTHDPDGPAAWMSAIDGETGKLLWRTRLGSQPVGDVIRLAGEILWDDGTALHVGDPAAGFRAIPWTGKPTTRSLLIPIDETPLLRVGWTPGSRTLVFDQVNPASTAAPRRREANLPEPLAGDPIWLDGAVVVPLTSGVLARVDPATGNVVTGPDWRVGEEGAEPKLARSGPSRFLASDGRGGVTLFAWDGSWRELARRRRPLPGRSLAGPPAQVDAGLVIVDDGGSAVLLDPERLTPRRDWSLAGKPTAGPFVLGEVIAVVLDGKRLAAFRPDRDGIAWDIGFLAEIAVPPALIDGRIVVVDVQGNFWTVDPATGGTTDRPAFSLRADVAAASTPIAVPSGWFVILSDGAGTVIERVKTD